MFSQPYLSISRTSERKELSSSWFTIIKGPYNTPVFLYLSPYKYFKVLDNNTMEETKLPHSKTESAIGIDDEVFATASVHSIKLWRFDNLTLVKKYKIFEETPIPYTRSGAEVGLQLLPEKVLVTLLISDCCDDAPKKVFSTLFVIDLKTGNSNKMNLSDFKNLHYYKITAIPNQPNQFMLYDHVHEKKFYIFEINWKEKHIHLVEQQKNLTGGSFHNIHISFDGQYWAIDMRYSFSEKPVFGTEIYKIDEYYKLTCIEKMFEAGSPQWNGNKLLYFFEKRICEFNPKDLSHTILTNPLPFDATISPCFSNFYFQVVYKNQLDTYKKYPHAENYEKEWMTEVDQHTQYKIPFPLIKIMGEYLGLFTNHSKVETIDPVPLNKFGLLTLFKKPSKNGLIDCNESPKEQVFRIE